MMLVEAIQASLLQEEAQAAALPKGDGHSAAAATIAAPGLAAPAAQAPVREPALAQAGSKAPGTAASPGLGASPGANPSAGRRSSGGLRGLFSLRGSARRSPGQAELRTPVPQAVPDEPAPAPDLAAQPLPAEQNAAREMLHAPGERDAAVAEGPGAAHAPISPEVAAGAAPQADSAQPAAPHPEQGCDAPAAPGLAPGSGPGFDLNNMRARAAAVRAARAWQPPGGVAELEAALPMVRDPTEELLASGEPWPSEKCRYAGGPRRSVGAAGQDSGGGAAPRACADGEVLRGNECGGAAAGAGARAVAGCGAGGKGGRAVPILADAGGGGDGAGAPHARDGPVKPPPQTPRGAMDYSALASGRWDEC